MGLVDGMYILDTSPFIINIIGISNYKLINFLEIIMRYLVKYFKFAGIKFLKEVFYGE